MDLFPGSALNTDDAQVWLDTGIWSEDTFADVFEKNVKTHPDLVHRDDSRKLTNAELWREAESVAAVFLDLGVHKGSKVAVQLPTSLDFVVALFAATRIGAVAVILQADLGSQAIADSLRQSQASVFIVADNIKGHELAQTAVKLASELPDLRAILIRDAQGGADGQDGTGGRVFVDSFTAARLAGHTLSPAAEQNNRPEPLSPFAMVFTAGTTGRPKGIVHLHANTLWAARTYANLYGLETSEGMLCLAPVYHLTGLLVGLTMPIASNGRMLLLNRFSVRTALRWIESHQVRYMVGAPPHLIHIAESPHLQKSEVSSVNMFFYAGAPVPSDILKQLQRDTGWKVGAMFGWSEGFLACATRPDDPVEAVNQTVGTAIPGMDVKLVDDKGEEVKPGMIGEMWCKGPSFSAGYYKQPEFSQERWDANGWFHSGDLLRQDNEGRFQYKGRRDAVINRGGTKIDPKEVEAVCLTHPLIEAAAMTSIPDKTLGSKTILYVMLPEGVDAEKLADTFDAQRLADIPEKQELKDITGMHKPTDTEKLTLENLRWYLTSQGLASWQAPDKLAFVEVPKGKSVSDFSRSELLQLAAESEEVVTYES